MKKKISLFAGLVILIIILVFLNGIVDFIVNIEWYKEVGYLSVFFTRLFATLKLMIPAFLISVICIYLYYKSLMKSIIKFSNIDELEEDKKKSGKKLFILFDVVISFFISYLFSSSYWKSILQYTNASDFNIKDPIFFKDISFFIFKLPLIESIYRLLMGLSIFLVIITVVIYFLLIAKERAEYGKEYIRVKNGLTKFAGRQLAIVSAIIVLLLSVGYLIKSWNLVYSPRGVVFGAGYTDIKITLNFYRIIAAVCIIAAVVIFVGVLTSKLRYIVVSLSVIFGLIVLEGVLSIAVQNFVVRSNERGLETPYIKNNIEYTRKAFNIDNIEEKDFNVKNDLTKEDLVDNKDTIENIKVNSYKQAMEFYNQVQVKRYYYDFNDIDVDRYNINGKYTQVFISPREIDLGTLEGNANTWQNKHLTYTHGYGVVMNKVNSVTSEGQPDFIIRDIPLENDTGIKIDNPRIYFGEKTNDYSIVDTSLSEFDYPKSDDENAVNKYEGKAGIKLNPLNKILFSLYEKNINFLLSRDINSSSKILMNRNILERVKKIAPFLMYDSDPYIAISKGKLYWIVDGFTVSDRYPYSQPDKSGINYIRNSVKVIVDANDGTTNFYAFDKNDPIVKSYSKIFTGLFKEPDDLYNDIKEHFRYPEDLFNIQSNVLGKYHVTDSDVFYKGEELWETSRNQKSVEGETQAEESCYVVMKLPQEQKEEMVLLGYFNMRSRDNMAALYGARMDGDNYGKMVIYKFPSKQTIFSPYLFKQKLNQDTTISKELSLWNKGDSMVQFGDTVIVPIKNSLLYVEPMYLRAKGNTSIPEMKRVIVSYSDKIVIDENIDDALKQLFNIQKTQPSQPQTLPSNNLSSDVIKKAKELYDKAIESQKNGDWAQYGEYIKSLGDLLSGKIGE